MSPIISYQLISGQYIFAFGLMTTAALSDMVDGYIARNFPNQKSLIGSFLDPLADKILVFALSLSLWSIHLLPIMMRLISTEPITTGGFSAIALRYLMALFVTRDVLLSAGAAFFRYRTLERRDSWRDVLNPRLLSAQIEPLAISKVNTMLQMALIGASMGVPIWGYGGASWLTALQIACCATTIASGCGYAFSKQLRNLLKQ